MAQPVTRRPGWAARAALPGLLALIALTSLQGCALPLPSGSSPSTANRLQAALPADAILLGETHDNPAHQRIHTEVIETLAERGELAALVLEMAVQGNTTQGWLSQDTQARLERGESNPQDPRKLSEPDVRSALHWDDRAWSWAAYKPAIMAAVRAGVPVMGANLPRTEMRATMQDATLDTRLSSPSLKAQQQLIRSGHCNLLPEAQVTPMTRIQIARDISLAQAIARVVQPGKTVVLLAGSGHVDRQLGVPQHLPAQLNIKAVQLLAEGAGEGTQPPTTDKAFDITWSTRAVPPKDYCAQLQSTLQNK